MDDVSNASRGLGPAAWGGIFFTAMMGAGIGARIADLDEFWSMAVMIPPMLLLIPLVRASNRTAATTNALSPALKQYNQRGLLWSFGYVIALFAAIFAYNSGITTGPLAVVIALLPVAPVFYMIWSVGRYLSDEQDEYVRSRQMRAALIGGAVVLAVGTLWGFLETFGLVPHVWAWWVVPVWAVGMGLGTMISAKDGV